MALERASCARIDLMAVLSAPKLSRVGLIALLLACAAGAAVAFEPPPRFAAMYGDASVFERSLAKECVEPADSRRVTGITVPHHLVATDLIVRGFRCASGGSYERIILLRPTISGARGCRLRRHAEAFETVFRRCCWRRKCGQTRFLRPVQRSRNRLCSQRSTGSTQCFPLSQGSSRKRRSSRWPCASTRNAKTGLALVDTLAPLIDSKTLVIQSTDFSHYLDHGKARRRDQQTMNALALNDPEAVTRLRQPAHLDSKAAQFVQMALQRRVHNASPVVIANRNSQAHTRFRQERTTSYIVQVYEPDDPPPAAWPPGPGEEVWFFAGDAIFGRGVASMLAQPSRAEAVRQAVTPHHARTSPGGQSRRRGRDFATRIRRRVKRALVIEGGPHARLAQSA